MNIQTRPISDLPEMSKDSQTAQFMVYDEADQTPKRMPRSVIPVFIVVKLDAPDGDILMSTLISISYTPDEVRSFLKSDVSVLSVFNTTDSDAPTLNQFAYGIVGYQPEDARTYGGLYIRLLGLSFVIHAIDGSNTWEIGPLPEKSST